MKIKVVFFLVIIFSWGGYAQVAKTTNGSNYIFTSKDSALCKPWKLVSIEEFGVANPPSEKQKNDGITFTSDGTVFFTRDGKVQTGTWLLDKNKSYVNLTFQEPKEELRFKLMKVDERQLKYEYQDPHLVRTIYNFEPLKK